MSKITTEDCKNFIKNHFGLTSTVSIKRDRKYKDANGDYIREFKFNTSDSCLIKEDKSGQLSILDAGDIVARPKAEPKEFNAKAFLKKHIKKMENRDYDDDDDSPLDVFIKETKNLSDEDKVKVANEFCFFFPDETYDNETRYVKDGLNTLMIGDNEYTSNASFNLWFYDSLNSEPDLYVSDILRGILPDYIDKVDEYHFELNTTPFTKTLTIGDIIVLLEHLGFRYKNDPEWEDQQCMLVKLNLK